MCNWRELNLLLPLHLLTGCWSNAHLTKTLSSPLALVFSNIRTAWKAQFREHSNSSEKIHLSFERENVPLSAILLVHE